MMQYGRKMVLVDADDNNSETKSSGKIFDIKANLPSIQKIAPENKTGDGVVDKQLSELDQAMLTILNSKNLSDYEKVKLYNELLRKYILTKNEFLSVRKRENDAILTQLTGSVSRKIAKVDDTLFDDGPRSVQPSTSLLFPTASTPASNKKKATNHDMGILTQMFAKYATPQQTSNETPKIPGKKTRRRFVTLNPHSELDLDDQLKVAGFSTQESEDLGGFNQTPNSERLLQSYTPEDFPPLVDTVKANTSRHDDPFSPTRHQTSSGQIKRWEKLRRS